MEKAYVNHAGMREHTFGCSYAAESVVKEREIPRIAEELAKANAALGNTVSELCERLTGVSAPSTPPPLREEAERPICTPIGGMLGGTLYGLRSLDERLRHLLSTLEV